jgi:[ribosomal protein S5]-alanine N-acetyltransferase
MGHEVLRTARLTLRRPTTDDLPAIYTVHADPVACAHNPSDGLVTVAEARALFTRWDRQWRRSGFGYWVVCRREGNEALGFCGVRPVTVAGREALNLFYRLAPAEWGHGFATEAASTVVAWAARHLADWAVVARVRPANLASQRVAQRAGLVRAPHLDEPGDDGPDWFFASP